MAKPKSTTELAVLQDYAAPQTLDFLKEELKNLKKVSETPFKTSGNFILNGITIDIKKETSIPILIRVMGIVLGEERVYNQGAEALTESLGNTVPAFETNGGNTEAWKSDINLRIQVVSQTKREEELNALITEGQQFLTKEDQYQSYLKKVSKYGKGS